MSGASRAEILKLYRSTLKAAQGFETYNFRKYFYRRTRDQFRHEAKRSNMDAAEVQRAMKEGREQLEVIKRQALVNRLFAHNRTVIEADPQFAPGARRFAE
ncbi:hypothetical protein GGI07_005818 [Coemansia sp. Benny D115]|nr:hypothetical protein GGI07_005818 [Coemansia sp. Benny D115]